MSSLVYCVIIFIGIFVSLIIFYLERKRLPEKRARFNDRESISLDDLFNTFYKNEGFKKQDVLDLWKLIAQMLKLDPEKLRPSDRFDAELGPVHGYPVEDEVIDVEDFVQHKCSDLGIVLNERRIQTLDDVIRILCPIGGRFN